MTTSEQTNGTTYYNRTDLGITTATVHRQGNYQVRCYYGPDEFTYSEWATREAAHNVARKHSAKF